MICKKCNEEYEGNFCPKCGTKNDDNSVVRKTSKGLNFKNKKIIVVVIVLLILIVWKCMDTYENDVIEYVKQYRDPDVSYPIGEYLEMSGIKVKWSYKDKDKAEYVIAKFDDPAAGLIEVVFRINEYPFLYDVLLEGESNSELINEFNIRLFGGDTNNIFIGDGEFKEDWYERYNIFESNMGSVLKLINRQYGSIEVEINDVTYFYIHKDNYKKNKEGAYVYKYDTEDNNTDAGEFEIIYYPDGCYVELVDVLMGQSSCYYLKY